MIADPEKFQPMISQIHSGNSDVRTIKIDAIK